MKSDQKYSISQPTFKDLYNNTSIILDKQLDNDKVLEIDDIGEQKENKSIVNINERARWKKMAYTLIQKDNPLPVFKLQSILEGNPLKGTKLFDFFVIRLKEWNIKAAKNNGDKRQASLFTFIYTHLKGLNRKPLNVQHQLLESLFAWYQENINPKPKISEILRGLKKKTKKIQTIEDENVRKTFNSGLSLKIGNFYRRQFGSGFNNDELTQTIGKSESLNLLSLEQKLTNRIRAKEEYNLRSWRQQKQLQAQVELALQSKTRREEMGYKTAIGAFRGGLTGRKQDNTLRPSSHQNRQSTPRIGGMTLMTNPFQVSKK